MLIGSIREAREALHGTDDLDEVIGLPEAQVSTLFQALRECYARVCADSEHGAATSRAIVECWPLNDGNLILALGSTALMSLKACVQAALDSLRSEAEFEIRIGAPRALAIEVLEGFRRGDDDLGG